MRNVFFMHIGLINHCLKATVSIVVDRVHPSLHIHNLLSSNGFHHDTNETKEKSSKTTFIDTLISLD